MLTINQKGSHHGPPGSKRVPGEYMHVLKIALQIIHLRIVSHYQSDSIFRALPKGRSFSEMFNLGHIWLNYDPSNKMGDYGWTIPSTHPHDIVITQYALRMGRWSTVGTIVHEMAHLNGADGTSAAAENTLRFCGLQSAQGPYDSHIRG